MNKTMNEFLTGRILEAPGHRNLVELLCNHRLRDRHDFWNKLLNSYRFVMRKIQNAVAKTGTDIIQWLPVRGIQRKRRKKGCSNRAQEWWEGENGCVEFQLYLYRSSWGIQPGLQPVFLVYWSACTDQVLPEGRSLYTLYGGRLPTWFSIRPSD